MDLNLFVYKGGCVCVCVRERESESLCVYVYFIQTYADIYI